MMARLGLAPWCCLHLSSANTWVCTDYKLAWGWFIEVVCLGDRHACLWWLTGLRSWGFHQSTATLNSVVVYTEILILSSRNQLIPMDVFEWRYVILSCIILPHHSKLIQERRLLEWKQCMCSNLFPVSTHKRKMVWLRKTTWPLDCNLLACFSSTSVTLTFTGKFTGI